MVTENIAWLPQWTTPVKVESGGQYPLGLNRFHNGLDALLINGITVNANSLPFLSTCCWAIGDIVHMERPQTWSSFEEAYRRRETALATGRYLWRSEDNIPGSTRVKQRAQPEAETQHVDYSVMKTNGLGAYGLYYTGSAYSYGLVEYDDNGTIVLTPSGQRLYEILEQRYRQSEPAYHQAFRGRPTVPTDVLRAWGEANDLRQIRGDVGQAEREFYQTFLFRLDEPETNDFRRDTLALLLECIDQCEKSNADFSENTLRNVDYYASYEDRAGNVITFQVPDALQDVHFYWGIYEGHVFFRAWLTRYFQVFLEHLKGRSNGSTADEFLDSLDAGIFDETVNDHLSLAGDWLSGRMGDMASVIDGPAELDDLFSESTMDAMTGKGDSPSTVVARFALMMVDLRRHFADRRSDLRYQQVAGSLAGDLWFDVLYAFPRFRQMAVRDFLRVMLDQHILSQHDRIMMEKHDLRRCWFTVENGRYFFKADASIPGRPAKYGTIMAYLQDMNLITDADGIWTLTEEGQTLRQRLQTEFYS